MANISAFLQKIKTAVYGEEVRGSIHDALEAMNTEASNAMEFASAAKNSAQAYATAAQESSSNAEEKAAEALSSKDAAVEAKNAAQAANTEAAASALSAQQYSGKPPKSVDGIWHIWDAAQQAYINTSISSIGTGISELVLTSGDHSPGSTDVYTITMTDGASIQIPVHNGVDSLGDVKGVTFDLVVPAAGWSGGEITVANEKLVASSAYQYFIRPDDGSRRQYANNNVQARDVVTTGSITFISDTQPNEDLVVNITRFEFPIGISQ